MEEWCTEESCLQSLGSLDRCIMKGITHAAFSLNSSYDDKATCTTFHGDNVLGYLNYSFLAMGGTVVLYVCIQLLVHEVPSFTSGKYMIFTTQVVTVNCHSMEAQISVATSY